MTCLLSFWNSSCRTFSSVLVSRSGANEDSLTQSFCMLHARFVRKTSLFDGSDFNGSLLKLRTFESSSDGANHQKALVKTRSQTLRHLKHKVHRTVDI